MAVSIGLVIFVVFVFLRSARATAIPGVAVPVSLDRHVRSHVPARLQPEQSVADGTDYRDRVRGGRRDRRRREHLAPSRERDVAGRGGPPGRRRDRVHRRLDQPVAGRGVHSDPSDGRHCRPSVPRGGGHADGGDHGLDGGLVDDHADDVRAASPFGQIAIARPDPCTERASLRRGCSRTTNGRFEAFSATSARCCS